RERSEERMRKVLQEAEGKLKKDTADLPLLWARYWVAQGPARATPELERLARDAAKLPKKEEQERLLVGLARAQSQLGNLDQARALWQQLEKLEPKDLAIKAALFDLAAQEGDAKMMDRLTHDMKSIEGEKKGTLWRYGEAARLVVLARKDKGAKK